jgi:hypothetical protein
MIFSSNVRTTPVLSKHKFNKLLLIQDGVVRYYNLKEATGNRLLTNLEKGRYAETDVYVAHEDINAEKSSVLLVCIFFSTPNKYRQKVLVVTKLPPISVSSYYSNPLIHLYLRMHKLSCIVELKDCLFLQVSMFSGTTFYSKI